MALVEQVLLDPPRDVPVQSGLFGMEQLGALHLLGGAHHYRRFRCGVVVCAKGVPLDAALGHFMGLHAVSPGMGAILLMRSS